MLKTIRLWYLYDFANSFASAVVLFYYPLILLEKGASNAWVGVATSVSTIVLLFILPYLGTYADKTGKRFFLIKLGALGIVFSLVSLAYVLQKTESITTFTIILLSDLCIFFYVSFHTSYLFYASMLRQITETTNNVKVSGVGLGFGQLGNILALGILGPVVASSVAFFGLQGKPLALFLGGVAFISFSVPFLLQKDKDKIQLQEKLNFSYKKFIQEVISNKKLFFFLIGCSLLANAVLTFQLYVSIYLKKVFSFSDQLTTFASITALIFAVIGGFFANTITHKLKDKQTTLQMAAILAAICFGFCSLMPKIAPLIFASLALSGFSYGLVFSLSRAVYSEIVPVDKQGQYFSIFIVFERAASIIGPTVWIVTFFLLSSFGEGIKYRSSMFLLLGVCFLGLYFLKKSKHS